ncbi:dihydropyrimidinase [Spirochaeta isovalerica]|uniref:Dihydropyrimidinase n=1 Tax=Spirochaeta isovalerica TaxID=150 RepID=A0A841R2T3_9SPIO|nr:dihydropyrimidinase [Spirochaeta isovalerica]MBB6479344.1 dihydropyrimidinase [Spirochaeta isovalerica]
MKYDLVIKNGTIVTAMTSYKADIAIKEGKISAIGQGLEGKEEIDATDRLVTPGAIDTHVHLEMPIGKFVSSDDFYHGTKAAAFGGTTSIIDFVESKKDQTFVEALKERKSKAADKALIDYRFHMTIGPDDMKKLDQVQSAYDAGCRSFKIYMAYGLKLTDGEILKAFEAIGEAGALPVVHAENWDVITTLIDRNISEGNSGPEWHTKSRPALMEAEAVGRVIDLAAYAGVPVHIFHISCPEAAERVRQARLQGHYVSGETCPQYLCLTDEVFEAEGVEGALPICSPPIRGIIDQLELWEHMSSDTFHTISSDHCPFTKEEKATGLGAFNTVPGGVPSIEMRFPAIYTRGVREGFITENQWVDLCCTMPARLFGLENKGEIQVGKDADIVIFNPEKEMTLSEETLHETAGWTPYRNMKMKGWPETTISRGEVIIRDGECTAAKGRGKYLA